MSENNHVNTAEVTVYLQEFSNGNKDALDKLYPLVYNELQKGAHRIKKQFYNLDTMNTTAIVHEAYLKLIQAGAADLKNRAHFFYISARAMRQILINASLRKQTLKRGSNPKVMHLDDLQEGIMLSDQTTEDLLLLNDALQKLELQDERQAAIVECRFFGGMTIEETALALNISPATVKRSWSYAKAWLYVELNEQ